ncbi:MAG: heme-binding protein [Candidatus Acidiferrum sp.]
MMNTQDDSSRAEENKQPHTSLPHRFKQPPIETLLNLGPLALLAGQWVGTGFNVIWRPDNTGDEHFEVRRFLQLNRTAETLTFDVINSPIPNRGLANQPDITIYGLNYLQKVRDDDTDIPNFPNAGEDLHIEPGLFLSVPASGGPPIVNSNDANAVHPIVPPRIVPLTPPNIVRLATIPHGVSVRMQGGVPGPVVTGAPDIPPIYPIGEIANVYASYPDYPPVPPGQGATLAEAYVSFAPQPGLGIQPANVPAQALTAGAFHSVPENTLSNDIPYPNAQKAQSNGPFPAAWQAYVDDPNTVLRNATAGQTILGFIPIALATPSPSAISQIPFLGFADPALEPTTVDDAAGQSNAFVHSATATFWIEWVKSHGHHGGPHYHHDSALQFLDPFPGVPKFLQLQYTQTVILNFNGVLWPHVSVATLRQQF